MCVCMLVQAVQPKLEAMEAAWYRLHSISGAATPDQVIAYWEGQSVLCWHQRRHSCHYHIDFKAVCLESAPLPVCTPS